MSWRMYVDMSLARNQFNVGALRVLRDALGGCDEMIGGAHGGWRRAVPVCGRRRHQAVARLGKIAGRGIYASAPKMCWKKTCVAHMSLTADTSPSRRAETSYWRRRDDVVRVISARANRPIWCS